jgi:hypothetical protein
MVMPQGGSIIPTSKGMGINLMWKQEVDHELAIWYQKVTTPLSAYDMPTGI